MPEAPYVNHENMHTFNRPEGCICETALCRECGKCALDHYWKCQVESCEAFGSIGNGEHEHERA